VNERAKWRGVGEGERVRQEERAEERGSGAEGEE
jgi:hypothetical protein